MSDRSHINWEHLSSYLSGELSSTEGEAVERWIAECGEHQAIVAQLRAAWGGIQPVQLGLLDAAELQHRVWRRVNVARPPYGKSTTHSGVKPMSGRQPLRGNVWAVTMSLVVCVLGILLVWNGHSRQSSVSRPSAPSRYTTANAERANVTLPDGSLVALDVASRLDVPADYAAGNHTVYLTGEALFTVTRHEGTPFTVIAGTTVARVLGTTFAMRRYKTDTTATVAVRDGKVAVGNVVVTAARLLEVGPHGVVQQGSADAAMFGFATGVMQITSMPLSRAATELNRWYGTEIRFGDTSLAHVPIEGKFIAGSVADLANYLNLLLNVRVVRDGRVLTIYPKTR